MDSNTFHQPVVNWRMELTDLPSDFSYQQMREAESIGWKGGDNFFDGLYLALSPGFVLKSQTLTMCRKT